MPLVNGLPLANGAPWSATAPQQTLELITTYDLDEKDALATPPGPDLAWGDIGVSVGLSNGILKVPHSMPQTANFADFKYGGDRNYHNIDVVAQTVKSSPKDLSYAIPMVWDNIGNGWKLMSSAPDGSLLDFVGISGLAALYVTAGRHRKCQELATLFYSGLYATTGGLSITTPTKLTYPQGASTGGIALFTDGTGAAGSAGAEHYANPTVFGSGRFKNVWFGFGSFESKFQASLVKMAIKPNALFDNTTSGARVKHVFGPTKMYDKFYNMAVQTLTLQTATLGNDVGAATTNPLAEAVNRGFSQSNFIGTTFGPYVFWILPQLDNHPYLVQNPTADFWINVSAGVIDGAKRGSWANMASNNKECVPVFRMYGPGDPLAMSRRMMRWEGDLDIGAAAGVPGEIDMFGSL